MIISRASSTFRVLGSRSRLIWRIFSIMWDLIPPNLEIWIFTILYLNDKVIWYRTFTLRSQAFWFLHSHNYYMSWTSLVQCLPTQNSLVPVDLYRLRCLICFVERTKRALTLKVPRKHASENAVCLCRLMNTLANFSNLFLHTGRQCGPRSDCSYRSSLIWVHTVCKNDF